MLTTLNIKQDAKLVQNKPEHKNKLTFLLANKTYEISSKAIPSAIKIQQNR